MSSASGRFYTCGECRKSFRSDQNLREHIRTHTGERPYKCRICDMAFKTSGTRCRHERNHDGCHESLRKPINPVSIKKMYACTRCQEEFSSGIARSKHMKESHDLSGQYFCLQCDVELSSFEEVVTHHGSEHSSEFSLQTTTNQDTSSHAVEHQDRAFERSPLYDMNVNSSVVSVENHLESEANASPSIFRNAFEHHGISSDDSDCIQYASKQKIPDSADRFVCKYCKKEFSKLPLFFKHLMKHSEAMTNPLKAAEIKLEPLTVKSDSFADNSNTVVDSTPANNGQTVMMTCRSSPVFVEVKTELESETELDVSPEAKVDLQQIVDEFSLQEIKCEEVQEFGDNSSDRVATVSSNGIASKQSKRNKHGSKKSDHRILNCNSDNSVQDRSRVRDPCTSDGLYKDRSNKTVNGYVLQGYSKVKENNSEDDSPCLLEGSKCGLDRKNTRISCEKCGGRLNACGKQRYFCEVCGETFQSSQLADDSDTQTNLSVQDGEFSYRLRRETGPKANSAKKFYVCSHCDVKFKTKKLYDLHKKTRAISRSAVGDRATPEPRENSERKLSTNGEPFSCIVCGRRFAFKYRLERHMLIHTREKPFVCNDCGKGFTTKAYLQAHTARHANELSYLCSACGKGFADRIAWRDHMRVHDLAHRTYVAVKKHICSVCGLTFNRASNLARHELKHRSTEEFSHKCDECGRKFRTKEGCRYHVGQHAKEKPYVCMDCTKTFANVFCLKIHSKLHGLQGSFECGVCGKRYRTMSILKMHAKHHTNLRHSCNVCGEAFGFARQLRSHMIKHRPPFQCEVCGVTTTRATCLRKHRKRFQHY